jgi:hypothetical protein
MADTFDYDKLAEVLARAIAGRGADGRSAIDHTLDITALKKQLEKLGSTSKIASEKTMTFSKFMGATKVELTDVTKQIKSLDQAIEDLEDVVDSTGAKLTAAEKSRQADDIRAKQSLIKQIGAAQNLSESFFNLKVDAKDFGKTLGDTAASAAGTLIKGLQGGTSAIVLSTGLMSAAATTAGAGLGLLGTAFQVGSNFLTGKFKFLAKPLDVLGAALGFIGPQIGKLAKFGFEVLSAELEKTAKAFTDASAAGAIYANGMTGLVKAAGNAGLAIDQFANVLKNNSSALASLGLGVSGGAELLGKALQSGGVAMKRELLKLGYSIEDQANLVAETMEGMRGVNTGKFTSTQEEVATQTMKYAENLRLISAITGEDARKKQEQQRQENNYLAFQQSMAKKTPKQQLDLITAMSQMTKIEKQNLREREIYGRVMSAEGLIYENNVKGAREKGELVARQLKNNELTTDSVVRANIQFRGVINDSILSATDMAKAGDRMGGVTGEVSKDMSEQLLRSRNDTEEAYQKAKDALATLKLPGTDPLTEGVVDAQIAAQNLKVAIQDLLLPAVTQFATVAASMLEVVESMLKDVLPDLRKGTGEKIGEKIGSTTGGIAGTVAGAVGVTALALSGILTGGMSIAIAGLIASGTLGYIGSEVGGAQGGAVGKVFDPSKPNEAYPGKAKGGISTGPTSGFWEKLHGTEAVIPLPDGKTIPVSLDVKPGAAKETGGGMGGGLAGAAKGALLGAVVPVIGPMIGGLIGGVLGSMDKKDSYSLKDLVKALHMNGDTDKKSGKLDDSIRTDTLTSGIFAGDDENSIGSLKTLLSQQLALMKETLDENRNMLSVISDSKNLQQQLLNNSY